MINESLVDLSRLQFAATAFYHFLFVPLTLGLSFLLAIMESVYVMTGKTIYRDMTKFWGKLFGINFALGVTTGLTMEFQFGTNWAYYSHYVGDIFGAPLAIEGLMASPAPTSIKEEATSNVQMEATQQVEDEVDNAISAGEGADAAAPQTDTVNIIVPRSLPPRSVQPAADTSHISARIRPR